MLNVVAIAAMIVRGSMWKHPVFLISLSVEKEKRKDRSEQNLALLE